MTFTPLGDSAVVVTLGATIDEATLLRVRSLTAALERERDAGIIDVVPAYTTVTVFYENAPHPPEDTPPYERIRRLIAEQAEKSDHSWPDLVRLDPGEADKDAARELEIPVCYGGELGPDIEEVARRAGLAAGEVAELHSSGSYVVHAVGFTPGFPYLGGLPEKLHTPRRATPRTHVPAGAVGIGGRQTGVYPIATPGGWQLIGRTPLALFRVAQTPPALLRVGDRVKFRPITREEFAAWK
jgi:inhibitor of KinA